MADVASLAVGLHLNAASFKSQLLGAYGDAENQSRRFNRNAQEDAKKTEDAYKKVGLSISGMASRLAGLAGAGLSIGTIVTTSRQYGQALSDLQAITGATAAEMKALDLAAQEMGRTTEYSASQAAEDVARLQASYTAIRAPFDGIVGARQVGKTTLARTVVPPESVNYFDLEDPVDLARLSEPMLALGRLRGVVVIDEVQRHPDLFPVLRVLADREERLATFLVLGSASPDALRQSSEPLAGRIEILELPGLGAADLDGDVDLAWLRGGYSRAALAESDADAAQWLRSYLRMLASRDLREFGLSLPAATIERFLALAERLPELTAAEVQELNIAARPGVHAALVVMPRVAPAVVLDLQPLRRQRRYLLQRQRIVASDQYFRPQFAEVLIQIPGERVIVIDKQDHSGSGNKEPRYSTQFPSLRLPLCEISSAVEKGRPSLRSGWPGSTHRPQYRANPAYSPHE